MFVFYDVNAFYASCETVFRPDSRGKPVAVLSNNDNYIIAQNAETKVLGVKMGDPWFKRKDLSRRCGVICSGNNYELHAGMSNRVTLTLEELSSCVEIYSIDEVFCDLTGIHNCCDLTDFGRGICAAVLQRTHLTVDVGIAQTKTLAELTNYAAEKWQRQTGGVVDLSNLERQRKLISALPVDEVWRIGRWISKRLDVVGIETVLDLADSGIRFIHKHFNIVLKRTVRKLRGEPCLQLEEFVSTKQGIICSRSFGERITDYPSMRQTIRSYAARAAEKPHSEHQYCRSISTSIKTSPFALNEPYYGNSASVKLLAPTQDSRDIISAAARPLDAIWQASHYYQKTGVMLGDFSNQRAAQFNLFDDNAPRLGSEQLIVIMDTLNAKEGKGTLYFAGQGAQQRWQMKHAILSPCYTTQSSDLLRVK